MKCPRCGSLKIKKAGTNTGKQRWKCFDCEDEKKRNPDGEIRYYFSTAMDEDYNEILTENIKLSKSKQKFQDSNRIERKTWRGQARLDNALEEYNKELIDILEQYQFNTNTIKVHKLSSKNAGIIHFTDAHFNELVELPFNRYDFKIAAKRTQKLISEAKRVFHAYGITNVLFAMTGDMMNSDRRLDELLNKSTNRAKATFLAVEIIQQMLLDLNLDFNVTVASVLGNESRCTDDIQYSEILATDNYDFTIHEILRKLLDGNTGIHFYKIENPMEQVVKVANKNILLIHGHQKKLCGSNITSGIDRLVRKYSDKGIRIDFVLFGHIHQSYIADLYARGSSLVGANSYSENSLMLTSRASQNIHIVSDDIHSMKIDLQNCNGFPGYAINDQLEEYNAKSLTKTKAKRTVFEVVI